MKYLPSVYCVITSNARWECRLCHLQSGKPECHEHCTCGMRNNIIDPATIVFFYFFRPLRFTLSYFWRHSSCFAFARGQCWGARSKASLDAVSRKQGGSLPWVPWHGACCGISPLAVESKVILHFPARIPKHSKIIQHLWKSHLTMFLSSCEPEV